MDVTFYLSSFMILDTGLIRFSCCLQHSAYGSTVSSKTVKIGI